VPGALSAPKLRIGEFSRRVGVSDDVLRAWERRYGLVRPERSPGGFRLYSPEDEARVRAMLAELGRGLAAAEAAALARQAPEGAALYSRRRTVAPRGLGRELVAALAAFDDASAQASLDRAIATLTIDSLVRDVLLPVLREIGRRWEHGTVNVAQEHFASSLIQARMLALSRAWDRGLGPRAVLACAPGELHACGLIGFGLALRERGWRITYLGPDTPAETLAWAAAGAPPASAVVVSSVAPERFLGAAAALAALAGGVPVAIGGAGADQRVARRLGARLLAGDPVEGAEELSDARRASA
jgi:MerR family transcriptional regulator, light-induced transcriptional regulator